MSAKKDSSSTSATSLVISPKYSAKEFPSDVHKWMKANAAPKIALKLMQTNKYFQHQVFPYLVIKDTKQAFFGMSWGYQSLDNEWHRGTDEIFPKKIWMCHRFYWKYDNEFLSKLIPNVAVWDLKEFHIQYQRITLGDLKMLTVSGNIEKFYFYPVAITSENNEPIFVEDILKMVPNVTYFHFQAKNESFYSTSSFAKIVETIDVTKVRRFSLWSIPAYGDFEVFLKFMDKNPQIYYEIDFVDCLTPQQTQILQSRVDKISEMEDNKEHPKPTFYFTGKSRKRKII